MQNSLELAMQTLKHMPAHATREVLFQIITKKMFLFKYLLKSASHGSENSLLTAELNLSKFKRQLQEQVKKTACYQEFF